MSAPEAVRRGEAVAILVVGDPRLVEATPLGPLLDEHGVPAKGSVMVLKRADGAGRRRPRGRHGLVLVDTVGRGRSGEVVGGRGTCDPLLAACCFYHRWMDETRRAKVDHWVAHGDGVMMIAAGTLLAGAALARRLMERGDLAIQLHEFTPPITRGAAPEPTAEAVA